MEHTSSWSMLTMLVYRRKFEYSKESAGALLQVSREDCLEVNTEKTKYMFMFRHHNT